MRPCETGKLSLSEKRNRRQITNEICVKMIDGEKVNLKKLLDEHPWLSRHMINGCLRRQKSKNKTRINDVDVSVSTNNSDKSDKGGRPVGSSRVSRIDYKCKVELATEKIATSYLEERIKNGGTLKRGMFKVIHDKAINSLGLHDTIIKQRTILSRIYRNSLHVNTCQNQTAPLLPIEPFLLQIAMWKQEAGQPITPSEGIQLANSLIDGKPTQDRLREFQKSIKAEPTGLVSAKFWLQFVKRNKEKLEVGKGYRVAGNITEWVTYENVELMYDLVYEQMVKAGVAKKLAPEDYYYVDDKGQRVSSKEESVGMQVKVEVTHPEWILFGDEVGTNISQKTIATLEVKNL